jgi:hypothetical protein
MNLKKLSNEQLATLKVDIDKEQYRRLEEGVGDLQPGDKVVTLQSGFSGPAGVVAYYIDFVRKGETRDAERGAYGDDYHRFAAYPGGPAAWLLETHRLAKMIHILPRETQVHAGAAEKTAD